MDSDIIIFTDQEIKFLEREATEIASINEKGVLSGGRIKIIKSEYKRQLIGKMGEYAVARYLRLPMHMHNKEFARGDGGFDYQTSIGTIDVKCTDCQNEHVNLIYYENDKLRWDYAVMAQITSYNSVHLRGYTSRAYFFMNCVRWYKYGQDSRALSTEELFPMKALLDRIEIFDEDWGQDVY